MHGEDDQAVNSASTNPPAQPQQQASPILQPQQPTGENGEPENSLALIRSQKLQLELQLELQQREMQVMRGASEQQKVALEQSKIEILELREQFARFMNLPSAPTLTQPQQPNINQPSGHREEFQQTPEQFFQQNPGNPNFYQQENNLMSARSYGAPQTGGPGVGNEGTPSEPRPYGAQPNSGSFGQQGRAAAEIAETPALGRQPTAPLLGGVSQFGAQRMGEAQQLNRGEHHQHAHYNNMESSGGGQCCTKQQLPPLEPFDPEKSSKREYALFETEFKQRMKLEKVPYSEWGSHLLLFLKDDSKLFAFRWLSSYQEGQWDFNMLTSALNANFNVQNTPDVYQRALTTILWDPNKDTIDKHLSALRTLVMQAFPSLSREWPNLI
ncbi:MAG: hypothetical protein GY820_26970, partial [Gammaproteobacteria bacterium]|nr:hypothetical protein [Gammaproteobacteria bacterium]